MSTQMSGGPLRVARILNIGLIIVTALLILIIVIMLAGALMMLFDIPGKDRVIAQLQETGGLVPPNAALSSMFATGAVIAGAYLYVALVVRRIVRTTLEGNPFVDDNIARLRKTWVIIALVEIFRVIVTQIIPHSPQNGSALNSFTMETNLTAWFLVFVIATMAEVFRIGLELKLDQEFTV